MSSGRWEAKCGSWAELATARGDEVGRLRERLETIELVFRSLEQTTADQKHELDAYWKNYAAVKADCETLRKDLGEARVEPDALRVELEISKKELAEALAEPGILRAELSDSQAESEVLKAELADARAASETLERELTEARRESDASKAESAGFRSELEASRKESEAWKRELDSSRAAAQSHVEALIQEKADLVADSLAVLKQRDEEVREAKLETAEVREAAKVQSEAFRLELQELRDRSDRAVADYKASEAFDDALVEAGSYSYDVGFADGVRQVKRAYPEVDVSEIKVPPGDQSDDDADVAGAGSLADARVGTVEVVDVSEGDTSEQT